MEGNPIAFHGVLECISSASHNMHRDIMFGLLSHKIYCLLRTVTLNSVILDMRRSSLTERHSVVPTSTWLPK